MAQAELASAEAYFYEGQLKLAKQQAKRAKAGFLDGTPNWINADDILAFEVPKTQLKPSPRRPSMTLKTGLATALVAAVVAALVTAPPPARRDLARGHRAWWMRRAAAASRRSGSIEIVRNYLTKQPRDPGRDDHRARQAAGATSRPSSSKKPSARMPRRIFRSPARLCRRQSRRRRHRGRVLRLQLRLLQTRASRLVKLVDERRQGARRAEGAADLRRRFRGGRQGRARRRRSRANISRCIRSCSASPARPTRRRSCSIAERARARHRATARRTWRATTSRRRSKRRASSPQKLGLQGTPLYLIGDKVMPGAPDDLYDQLKEKVAEVRKEGCARSARAPATTAARLHPPGCRFAERRKSW